MDFKPFDETPLVNGFIVNDINYTPVGGVEDELPMLETAAEEVVMDAADSCHCGCDKFEDVMLDACEEFKDFTVHNVRIRCEGRILSVKVELCEVCRGRQVRIAVLLYEKEGLRKELRGIRVAEVTVPGCHGCVRDLTVGDFTFILPDDDFCCRQDVTLRVIAHYSSFNQ